VPERDTVFSLILKARQMFTEHNSTYAQCCGPADFGPYASFGLDPVGNGSVLRSQWLMGIAAVFVSSLPWRWSILLRLIWLATRNARSSAVLLRVNRNSLHSYGCYNMK
jgi:hypothetical protein